MTIIDPRPGLRAFLLADTAIMNAVGQRIHPVIMPQGNDKDCIVYAAVSGQGDHYMLGASRIGRPRYQIDAWSKRADTATAIAGLVKNRLDGFRGVMPYGSNSPQDEVDVLGVFFEAEREFYDSDSNLYRVSRDYLFWHREM